MYICGLNVVVFSFWYLVCVWVSVFCLYLSVCSVCLFSIIVMCVPVIVFVCLYVCVCVYICVFHIRVWLLSRELLCLDHKVLEGPSCIDSLYFYVHAVGQHTSLSLSEKFFIMWSN